MRRSLVYYLLLPVLLIACYLSTSRSCWTCIIDTVTNTVNDVANDVSDAVSTIADAVSGAASEVFSFFSDELSATGQEVLSAINKVANLTIRDIDSAVSSFNLTTWENMANGAKYVIVSLESTIQKAISTAANDLYSLFDSDFIPFPLDSVEDDDIYDMMSCFETAVYDFAIEWIEEVATTLVSLDSSDITPIFNSVSIQEELNKTYNCFLTVADNIYSRKSSSSSILDSYFQFDELVIGLELSYTACVLTCGSATIGFAVSTTNRTGAPYWTVLAGVDTSSVVGTSITAALVLAPNWQSIPGEFQAISFGINLGIPFMPSLPTVDLIINEDSSFGGFNLVSDIINLELGLNGAFTLGYYYGDTKWIQTLSDLKSVWTTTTNITKTKSNLIAEAIDVISTAISSGAYIINTSITASPSSAPTVTLSCPSSESDAGNASILTLGEIEIFDVLYGNIDTYYCNSSTAYSIVTSNCVHLSDCTIEVSTNTFGSSPCPSSVSSNLQVIYGCPYQKNVYDIGCFKMYFLDVVDNKWYQDYVNPILDDSWETRENGLAKCAKIAEDNGYAGFGMYNHGMCVMASDLFDDGVYNKYGFIEDYTQCGSSGKGASEYVNLYVFVTSDLAYEDLGCYNETLLHSIHPTSAEGQHYLTQDNHHNRSDSIAKCAQIANEKGYKGFALYDNGACYLSNSYQKTKMQSITGTNTSRDCSSGRGSSNAYNVYTFPYISSSSSSDSLTAGEISMIVIFPLLFIILLVAGYFVWRYYKQNNKYPSVKSLVGVFERNDQNAAKSRFPNKNETQTHQAAAKGGIKFSAFSISKKLGSEPPQPVSAEVPPPPPTSPIVPVIQSNEPGTGGNITVNKGEIDEDEDMYAPQPQTKA